MDRSRGRFLRMSAGIAAGPFAGAFAAGASAAETYTLRMSLPSPMTTGWNITASQWARNVATRSNGQLQIEIYPSNQLANERASIEGLQSGVVDLACQSIAWLESLAPRFQVLDLPFMFKDAAAAFRVLDGPIGNELFADLDPKGITGLVWGSAGGFREMETTTRAIRVPDDMKGVRMRIQNAPVYVAMMQALGAIPVIIDAPEVFMALQSHTVDGTEQSLEQTLQLKYYTVIQHVAMTNHIFSLQPLLASKKKLEALPRDLQKILTEEALKIRAAQRALEVRHGAEAVAELKEKGVQFTETDYPAFRKAVEPVYAAFQSKLGADWIDRVRKASGG